MVCQNCGSNDIVSIQGQNYCLNCGQLVVSAAAKAAQAPIEEAKKPAVEATTSAPNKAVEEPVAAAGPIAAAPAPVAVAPVIKAPSKPKQPVAVSHQAPALPRKSVPRRVSDIGRSKATVDAATAKTVTRSQPSRQNAKVQAGRSKTQAARRDAGLAPAPRHYGASVVVRIVGTLAALVGLVAGLGSYFAVDTEVALYAAAGLSIGGAMAIALTHAGLLYGWSRQMDKRPLTKRSWWEHAWAAWSDTVGVTLLSAVYTAALAAVAGAAWYAALNLVPSDLPSYVPAIALGVVNTIVAWFVLGVFIARRMAVAAISVGGYSALEAFSVGWKLYRREGGHMVMAVIDSLVLRLVLAMLTLAAVAGAIRGAEVVQAVPDAVWVGGAGFVITFAVLLGLLVTDARLWLERYRHWAPIAIPEQRVRLLAGRATPITGSSPARASQNADVAPKPAAKNSRSSAQVIAKKPATAARPKTVRKKRI